MGYWEIAEMARSSIWAPVSRRPPRRKTTTGDPIQWQLANMLDVCAQPGWDAAWSSAQAGGNATPGRDPAVITDGMILSGVQSVLGNTAVGGVMCCCIRGCPASCVTRGLTVDETSELDLTSSTGRHQIRVAVIWHHDASPAGDSPGTLNWMIDNWNNSSANIWVDRYGVWHLVGTGVAWHAGEVLPGMPGNFDSIGIETDHTTGEQWPTELPYSLREGTRRRYSNTSGATETLIRSISINRSAIRPAGKSTRTVWK